MIFVLIPSSINASTSIPVIIENPFEKKANGDNEAQEQLNSLKSMGLIQSDVNVNLDQSKPDILSQYDEIDILKEETQLIAVDNTTGELITDINSIILGNNEHVLSQNIKPMSLTFYTVSFYFVVGNPDTSNADLINTATVTGCFGLECPDEYLVQLEVDSSDYKYFGYSLHDSESETVEKLEDVELIIPLNETKYWQWDGAVIALEGDDLVIAAEDEGGPFLLNSYGKEYPLGYEDPQSGINLYEPPANLNPDPNTRSSNYRSKFIQYYEENWGEPTEFEWSEVEIHHMRPLKYGGNNDVSNLIPLMNSNNSHPDIYKHSYLTRWWTYY